MDGGGTADFDDWEMLLPESAAAEEEIDVSSETKMESEGLMMLRLDHFSLNDENSEMMKYLRSGDCRSEISSGGGSVESDNPSWIDPAEFPRRNSGDIWPDSASDRSKLSDCEEKLGLGVVEESEEIHELKMESEGVNLGKLQYAAAESPLRVENEAILHEVEKMSPYAENSVEKMELVENPIEEFGNGNEIKAVEDGETEKEVEQPGHVEKKALLWWKLPLELVKFCVFRISPIWSLSVAAVMLGAFIIRRRLHMMKRKTKSLQMKVTIDDKKVDQFMSRAARLNEAFSVVRRVPILRPSLPAPGGIPWPIVSMR